MQYLIMECHELGDQWECDAERTPITLTENWKKWYEDTYPSYPFEVYEFADGKFNLVKEYDAPMEEGMVFAYYDEDTDEPTVLQRFPGTTRKDKVPKDILTRARKGVEYDNSLRNCGHISWMEDGVLYCYTEYYDHRICSPY